MEDRTAQIEFARTTSIVFVAGLAGGLAGTAVRGALAYAGAGTVLTESGAILTEALVFTSVDGGLNKLAGNEVHFGKDMLKNALMFTALRGAGKLFPKSLENSRLAFLLPPAKGAANLTVLQVFSEGEFALEHGRLMTADERKQSVVNAVAMGVALHLGNKLAQPLTGRLQAAIGAQFQRQRADLSAQLAKLEKEGGTASPEQLKQTLASIQELWTSERAAVEKAVSEGHLPREDADRHLHAREVQMKDVQLELARRDIPLQLTDGAPAYIKTGEHEIAYENKEAADRAAETYKAEGGSFEQTSVSETGEPVYAGRNKGESEGTLFAPRSSVSGGTRWPYKRGDTKIGNDEIREAIDPVKRTGLWKGARLTGNGPDYVMHIPGETPNSGQGPRNDAREARTDARNGEEKIDIEVKTLSPGQYDNRIGAPHYKRTGPAILELTQDGSGALKKATIVVDENVSTDDLPRAVQHELTELSVIAARQRKKADLDLKAETAPRLMCREVKPQHLAPAAEASAHDISTASELAPELNTLSAAGDINPQLRARMKEAGLDSNSGWDQKARLLEDAGVREDVIARLKASARDPAALDMIYGQVNNQARIWGDRYQFGAAEKTAASERILNAVEREAFQAYDDATGRGVNNPDLIRTEVKKKAEMAAETAAKKEAALSTEQAAQRGIRNGSAFDTAQLDAAAQAQLQAYRAGTTGMSARRLAPSLNGLGRKAFLTKMAAEVRAQNCTVTYGPAPAPSGSTQKMVVYEFNDGTVVRYKPQGDRFQPAPGPMFSIEVKKNPAGPIRDQHDIAFKVDEKGEPVPKGPDDVSNPYPSSSPKGTKHAEQHLIFLEMIMGSGHRTLTIP